MKIWKLEVLSREVHKLCSFGTILKRPIIIIMLSWKPLDIIIPLGGKINIFQLRCFWREFHGVGADRNNVKPSLSLLIKGDFYHKQNI